MWFTSLKLQGRCILLVGQAKQDQAEVISMLVHEKVLLQAQIQDVQLMLQETNDKFNDYYADCKIGSRLAERILVSFDVCVLVVIFLLI